MTRIAGLLTRIYGPSRGRTAFFNFTAFHDGIGARPLEGFVGPEDVAHPLQAVKTR